MTTPSIDEETGLCEFCDRLPASCECTTSATNAPDIREEARREAERLMPKRPASEPATEGNLRCSVLQENLVRALSEVVRAVAPRSTLAIANNVLIQSDNGRLRLQCTDLETTITTWIGGLIEAEGALTVDARFFAEAVGKVGPVSLLLDNSGPRFAVKGGRADLDFATMEARDWPRPRMAADLTEPTVITIPAAELRDVRKRVAVAAATENSRPVLACVNLNVHPDGSRTWAAADGFRLAILGTDYAPGPYNIPANALTTVAQLVGNEDVELVVGQGLHGAPEAVFRWTDHEVLVQLVSGSFPNYAALIPTDFETTWTLDTEHLAHAVDVAAAYGRRGKAVIRLQPPREGALRVWSIADADGVGEAECDGDLEGPATKIAFDSRYLSEGVRCFDGGRVALTLKSPSSQAMFRAPGDASFTYICMPMSVQWGDA